MSLTCLHCVEFPRRFNNLMTRCSKPEIMTVHFEFGWPVELSQASDVQPEARLANSNFGGGNE